MIRQTRRRFGLADAATIGRKAAVLRRFPPMALCSLSHLSCLRRFVPERAWI